MGAVADTQSHPFTKANAASIIAAHNARKSTPNKIAGKFLPRNANTLEEMRIASDMMVSTAGVDQQDPDAILHPRDDVTTSEKDISTSQGHMISIEAAADIGRSAAVNRQVSSSGAKDPVDMSSSTFNGCPIASVTF